MASSSKSFAATEQQGVAERSSPQLTPRGFKRRLLDRRLASVLDDLDEDDPRYFQRAWQRAILEMKSLQHALYGKPHVLAPPEALAQLYGVSEDIEAARAEVMPSPMTPSGAEVLEAGGRPYPDEYVVLVGARVDFHSPSQREAMMRYAELLRSEEQDQAELRFLPARAPQRHEVSVEETTGAPQIRGRALASRFERRR